MKSKASVLDLSPTIIYCIIAKIELMILFLLCFILSYKWVYLNLFGVFFLGWYLVILLFKLNLKYTITEEIIIVKKGIISRTYDNIELFRIKDYQVKQSILQRMFGLMTVILYSRDLTSPTLEIKGITYDLEILKEIRGRVQEARRKNSIFEFS